MSGDRVLVASGDRLFAEGAAAHLGREAGWQVVGTASDGLEALAAVTRLDPSAVLVLGTLSRLGPAALAGQVRRRKPDVTVVILGEARTENAIVLPASADADAVLSALATGPQAEPPPEQDEGPDGVVVLATLTPRERVTLRQLALGRTMPEIARDLKVSEHTVRTHIQNLYAKLGVHNRLEVVRFAHRHGLVGAEDDRAG